ncbi:hypothetical protein CTAYLR_004042 [Chrysophaeum taylorii]|uniref:Uncharacterized protein n=1 Tax=Chrysophaeum taylorii TaxID=2483200 RepID=A0AAD7UPZ2_9STRA|nr:hypothetical protein CTAYLR_004042 [Chrysophaeum taylorii]
MWVVLFAVASGLQPSVVVSKPVHYLDDDSAIECSHFEECSGCAVRSSLAATPTALRARGRLEPLLGRRLEVVVGSPRRWRTQARLAAAPPLEAKSWDAGARLGLYLGGTHEVSSIPECEVHAAAVNAAARVVETACDDAGARGGEDLRYAQFQVERSTGKVALCLVWNRENAKEAAPVLPRLVSRLWPRKNKKTHETWASIWVNYRGSGGGNAILAPNAFRLLRGREFVEEKLFSSPSDLVDTDLELSFSPQVFRQANLDAFARLVLDLARWVPDGAIVCELYAGVGAIGLSLRPRLGELRCSDGNPHAERCFDLAARAQEARADRLCEASFLPLEAPDAFDLDAPGADVLIVDPPRRGLDPEVLEALTTDDDKVASLSRLIYVSCGFDAFERDLAALAPQKNAKWKLVHAQAHVFFPGSDHVETLAVFDRSSRRGHIINPLVEKKTRPFDEERGVFCSAVFRIFFSVQTKED